MVQTQRIRMTPTASAQEVLARVDNTMWNRELRAAAEIVSRRRRGRRRQLDSKTSSSRQQQSLEQHNHHEHEHEQRRHLQSVMGGKYNSYLPEDAPENLLTAPQKQALHSSYPPSCLSPLQKWFVSLIESIGLETWDKIEAYNITSLAYLYKHHVSNADGTKEYFGTYGDRTNEMMENHESLSEFWYVRDEKDKLVTNSVQYAAAAASPLTNNNNLMKRSNVVLLGMHGVDLADNDAKLIPTLQQMYQLDGKDAYIVALEIQTIIESLPGAFNNPVLTANAIAIQSLNSDGSKSERDSIIVGDGVFAFLEWLKLKKDGPDYIHSHEYGHHLQYDLGAESLRLSSNSGKGGSHAEETRRWEMMADVFGSYYLAHSTGGRMDAARLLEVHRAAFSLGDCEDRIDSHHGTPRQRECASNYGANLALASYLDGGHTIQPKELRRMFDEKYEEILALDDAHCEAVVDLTLLDKAIYGEIVGGSIAAGGDGASSGAGNANNNNNVPPPVQILETPDTTLQTTNNKHEPLGENAPQSGYESFDIPSENGWTYDTEFEAYDPEENASPANELDAPPQSLPNGGSYGGDQAWLETAGDQWVTGRTTWSGGSHTGSGWSALIAVVLMKILLVR